MENVPKIDCGLNTEFSQEQELAELIIKTLGLDLKFSDIAPEAPLYGEGLGLDSIDILEISLMISKTFGFKLSSADDNKKIFSSLRSLNQHIQQHRIK